MFGPEPNDLTDTQACTIGGFQQDSVLQIGGGVKEPFDLFLAQDAGDLFDPWSRRHLEGCLVPKQDVSAEAQDTAENVVHRPPGQLSLFCKVEDVGLNLVLRKRFR
jgi:hypothetical protein